MVGAKGYPLEKHLKAQKHCLLTDILISDRADSAFSFSAKILQQLFKILLRLYTNTAFCRAITAGLPKPLLKLLSQSPAAARLSS